MFLGEIEKFHSSSLPIWSGLSDDLFIIDQIWMYDMNFLWDLTFEIPRLPGHFKMTAAASSTVELANSVTSPSVNSLNFGMWVTLGCELVPASVSPMSWSHVLMDGEELDEKQYI